MAKPTRQDTYSVHISVNGRDCGIWDKLTGGELDSEEYKYNPGAMEEAVSLGGKKTTGNLTCSRLFDLDRDHVGIGQFLLNLVGKGNCVVKKQPLDVDGNAGSYKPLVYRGKLKRVTFPEHDSESSQAGLWEIEITPEGSPVIG